MTFDILHIINCAHVFKLLENPFLNCLKRKHVIFKWQAHVLGCNEGSWVGLAMSASLRSLWPSFFNSATCKCSFFLSTPSRAVSFRTALMKASRGSSVEELEAPEGGQQTGRVTLHMMNYGEKYEKGHRLSAPYLSQKNWAFSQCQPALFQPQPVWLAKKEYILHQYQVRYTQGHG